MRNPPQAPAQLSVEVVIFDMDGVLVDVSTSYRQTIAQTAETYLVQGLGFQRPHRPLIEEKDVACFKEIGGFNNDWDLTAGLLLYLLSLTDIEPPQTKSHPRELHRVLALLHDIARHSTMTCDDLRARKNFPEFMERVRAQGSGLGAVAAAVGKKYWGLVLSRGSLDTTNLVRRIFQEIYLGPDFESIHHLPPRFHKGKGLHAQETLLVPKEMLRNLGRVVDLGIASGRPGREAMLALNRFGITSCFRSLVTLDDIEAEEMRRFQSLGKKESLSKPHPFSILEAVRRITPDPVRSAYVGDLLDDIEAANRARQWIDIAAIGCLTPYKTGRARMRDLLAAHGADFVIESAEDLLNLFMRTDTHDGPLE